MAVIKNFWDLASITSYSTHSVEQFDANTVGKGGGLFKWIAANNAAITNIPGIRIKPTTTTDGYWLREADGGLHIDWFGVTNSSATLTSLGINQATADARYGTNLVDVTTATYDQAALQTALTLMEQPGYNSLAFSGRFYHTAKPLELPRYQVDSGGAKIAYGQFKLRGNGAKITATSSYSPTVSKTYSVTTVSGSSVVTTASTTTMGVGHSITGAGIPANSIIIEIVSPTSFRIGSSIGVPVNATASASITATMSYKAGMLNRIPQNQTAALTTSGGYVDTKFIIDDLHLENAYSTFGDLSSGIRLGPSYSSELSNLEISGFDKCVYLEFCLACKVNNVRVYPKSYGFYATFGEYWGGQNYDSQSNHTIFNGCRVYNVSGTAEIQELTLTGANAGGNITITLDSIAYVVPVAAGTAATAATEIAANNINPVHAKYLYFGEGYSNPADIQGWRYVQNPSSGKVRFIAWIPGNKTGTFSFNGGGTGLSGTFSEITTGETNTIAGFYLRGVSGVEMYNNIIEGSSPQYGVYFDCAGSTVVKDLTCSNTHVEAPCTTSVFYLRTSAGKYNITNIFNQYQHKNFITVDNIAGYPQIHVSGISYNIPSFFKSSNASGLIQWNFYNMPEQGLPPWENGFYTTGTITNGSNVITAVGSTANVNIGDRVCDFFTTTHLIPEGATVLSKTGNSITMIYKNGSVANATGTQVGAAIYTQVNATSNYSHAYCPLAWRRSAGYNQPIPMYRATGVSGTESGPTVPCYIVNIPPIKDAETSQPYIGR